MTPDPQQLIRCTEEAQKLFLENNQVIKIKTKITWPFLDEDYLEYNMARFKLKGDIESRIFSDVQEGDKQSESEQQVYGREG